MFEQGTPHFHFAPGHPNYSTQVWASLSAETLVAFFSEKKTRTVGKGGQPALNVFEPNTADSFQKQCT